MKRLLFSIILILSLSNLYSQVTYYVDAVAGDDLNTGTSTGAAWQTVGKVSGFGGFNSGDRVLFKRGQSFYGQLVPQSSGMTFDAYGGGANPIITGGTVLSSWTDLGGGIYEASLSVNPTNVVIGGVQRSRGRTPDAGWWNIDSKTHSAPNATITANELNGLSFNGATVVTRKNRWIIDNDVINSHTSSTIGFTYSFYEPIVNYGFYITNDIDCVTAYGEWFFDDPADKLKVYFGSAGTSDVTVSTIQDLISITGTTGATFKNIEFSFAYRDIVRIISSTGVVFENCQFKNSYNGIQAASGNCSGLTLKNCSFFDINNNGMRLEDASSVNNFLMEYCDFHRIGIVPGDGGNGDGQYNGINMGGSVASAGPVSNAILRYNRMDSVGYCGFMGGGDNLVIQNNIINEYCYIKDDGGGIYGFSPVAINKQIIGNFVINGGIKSFEGTDNTVVHAYGIYADGNSDKLTINYNTVINAAEGIFLHIPGPDVTLRNNTIFGSRSVGLMVWNSTIGFIPGQYISSQDIKHNIVMSLNGNTDKVADFQDMSGLPNDIATWGAIDSNYYMRPLDDGSKIYSNPASLYYTLAGWTAWKGHDANSYNSPKTFGSIYAPDSIRIEYNTTNVTASYSIPGRWIDHQGNAYVNSVSVAPYRSVVLLADGASTGYVPPDTLVQQGYVSWQQPIDAAYETLPGQSIVGGVRKKTTAAQGWDNGVMISQQTIQNGESFEFATGFRAEDYMLIGIHPFKPGSIAGNSTVKFALYTGNSTSPYSESGVVPFESDAHVFSAYQPYAVDSPWYRIKYEAGLIKYGKSNDGGATFTDFYTSNTIPTDQYYLIFQAYDPGDMLRIVRKKSSIVENVNIAPTVNGGNDQSITLPTNTVQLNASASDIDGTIVSYAWEVISGPGGSSFSAATSAVTNFSNLAVGTYSIKITVTDNYGATDIDTVGVSVIRAPNIAPDVSSGNDQSIQSPTSSVTLSATASDADGSIISYSWTKFSGPSGETITSPNSATTTVTGLTIGVYVFTVAVTDNNGAVKFDSIVITVNSSGSHYITSLLRTWTNNVMTVRVKYDDNTYRNYTRKDDVGAYIKTARSIYQVREGGTRLVLILNYQDGTVQTFFKK